ncbi:MAG: D-alanyl-D-alanine carboxypeptidase/D-alanyl-D-alanine endopeptidase [Phycisphaerales bacterium]
MIRDSRGMVFGIAALLVSTSLAAADSLGIGAAVSKSGLPRSALGIAVVDVGTGTVLANIDGDKPMAPASNMKVFTTGAALERLGSDYMFKTRLVLEKGATSTRLAVVGDGDPAFGDPELLRTMSWTNEKGQVQAGLTTEHLLRIWTDAVAATGTTRADELVIDGRIFDRECYHPTWPREQYAESYCAEVWGLNFHANVLHVLAAPASPRPVVATMAPDYSWLVTGNQATCRAGSKEKHTFWIARAPDSNELVLRGNLKTKPTDPLDITVHDTPSLFGELLKRRLEARGIAVSAVRLAQPTDPAFTGTTVGPIIQSPIATVVARANTDSENLYAEALVKRLGALLANPAGATPGPGFVSGTWSNGAAALRLSVAGRIGDSAMQGWAFDDGSGLSRNNRISAMGTAQWLRTMALDPRIAPTYLPSLALAGKTGTVKKRFSDIGDSPVEVRCKTGYIRGVSCLSGVAIAPGGRQIAFSVLGNTLEQGDRVSRARALQEEIVRNIVHHLEKSLANAGERLGG